MAMGKWVECVHLAVDILGNDTYKPFLGQLLSRTLGQLNWNLVTLPPGKSLLLSLGYLHSLATSVPSFFTRCHIIY
ncbi:hypothetical protein AMATHDRAFT_64085 [Amanita thiersii Skay4041]|uniref:Uncharacterized protein n=1 Tax=Amanita thiersii Skay4041 TaxID=703135 RepID=A0A2A9NFY6_9AGAR|nr:hypothetical protein AMATHDRAFT_64085 [Amanita thiersii Skay4041]